MITGIAHICYTVSDLDASQAFYCGQLGLKPGFDFVRDGERFGMYVHVGGRNFIELFVGELTEPAEGQTYRHLCLEVDDIQSTVAQLGDKGVEVSEPKMGTDHSWQAWVTDPDGNRIELHHYTPESKQGPFLS